MRRSAGVNAWLVRLALLALAFASLWLSQIADQRFRETVAAAARFDLRQWSATVTPLMLAGASLPAMLGTIQRYRADGAPRQVMADLRFAQSHAISRGVQTRLIIFDAAGQAAGAGYSDATKANRYRIEARPTGGAWPTVADTVSTNSNVLTEWLDLGADYRQAVTQARQPRQRSMKGSVCWKVRSPSRASFIKKMRPRGESISSPNTW